MMMQALISSATVTVNAMDVFSTPSSQTSLRSCRSIDVQLMHRALLVPELLQNIFEHLHQNLYAAWSLQARALFRKNFAALARTCKTFYEPAMDILWADMDYHCGIEPLLGCVTRLRPLIKSSRKEMVISVSAHYFLFIHLFTQYLNAGLMVPRRRTII